MVGGVVGVTGFVVGVGGDVVGVTGGVEVVLVEVVLVVVELVEVELVVVELVVEVVRRQSLMAFVYTTETPLARSLRSLGLTVTGRFATDLLRSRPLVAAAPQLFAATAADTWSSLPCSWADWSPDSRPGPPPQAASRETAKPVPPARSARGR